MHVQAVPRPPPFDLFISWLGAFLAILLLAGLNSVLEQSELHFQLLVVSFGASAVLVFGNPENKSAQPCNLVGQQVYFLLQIDVVSCLCSYLLYPARACCRRGSQL